MDDGGNGDLPISSIFLVPASNRFVCSNFAAASALHMLTLGGTTQWNSV